MLAPINAKFKYPHNFTSQQSKSMQIIASTMKFSLANHQCNSIQPVDPRGLT